MLSKKNRLTSFDIKQILKYGKVARSEKAALHFLNKQEIDGGGARFGVVVGKKVSKKATERNYYKRITRESLRGVSKNVRDNVLCAIVLKREARGANFMTIEKDIKNLFIKARLVNNQ